MRPDFGKMFGSVLLCSRWAMAPICLGLVAALVIDVVEFCRELVHVVLGFVAMSGSEVTLGVLKLVDLALIANLVLMIVGGAAAGLFLAAETRTDHTRNEFGMADFGRLKLRAFATISAIAAIDLLEHLLDVAALKKEDVIWRIAILVAFVLSGVMLAVMDRLAERP